MPNDLVEFWRRVTFVHAPFMHPCDEKVLRRHSGKYIDECVPDFTNFDRSGIFNDGESKRLRLALLPQPFCGDLSKADILICNLNPGLAWSDFWAEYRGPACREHLARMLAQDFDGVKFPFMWLDPEFCWHGGFRWWESKLRDVLKEIANKHHSGCYLAAMRALAQRLACVELVPYHSYNFHAHALIDDLESARVARAFIQCAAQEKHKAIIVTRQAKSWNIARTPSSPNVICYGRGAARGASLSPRSCGEKTILKQYAKGLI